MNTAARNVGTTSLFDTIQRLTQRIGGVGPLVLLLWPLVLIAINHNWLFLNTSADDWMYFGYFNDLEEHLQRFSDTSFYYGTRLPWIIPGYLLYSLFPPLVANYVLHVSMYYIVSFSLYGVLTITVHWRAALLTAMLLGSYSYFLIAIGADYVNGVGITYFCLSILCVVLAWKRRFSLFFLGLAGAAAASAIYTNLFYGSLLPGLVVLCIGLHHQPPVKFLLRCVVPTVVGALSATAFFGVINVALGGEFLFFRRSIQFASYATQLAKNPWIETPIDWPIRNPHLIYPILVLFVSVIVLAVPVLRQRLRAYPASFVLLAQYVVTAVVMLAFQTRPSTPVLQAYFYAGYIMPAMFLALGVLIALPLAKLSARAFTVVAVAFALGELGAFAFRSCWGWSLQDTTLPTLAVGLIWALSLLALYHYARIWLYALFIASFGVLIVAVPSAFTVFSNYYSFCVVDTKAQQPLDDNYQAVLKGVTAIQAIAPDAPVYFWYNLQEQQIYHALSGFFLGPWVHIGEEFPALNDVGSARAQPGSTIVLLSREKNQLALAEAVLREQGRTVRLLGQEFVEQGDIGFFVTVFSVEPVPEDVAQIADLDASNTSEDSKRYLKAGWAVAEQYGSWTTAPQAVIVMPREPLVALGQALDIIFDVPYTIATTAATFDIRLPQITVDVVVNDTLIETWNVESNVQLGERVVRVPAEVLARSDNLTIKLDIHDPHSPQDLGFDANDTRQLGIAVRSIRFVPVR